MQYEKDLFPDKHWPAKEKFKKRGFSKSFLFCKYNTCLWHYV